MNPEEFKILADICYVVLYLYLSYTTIKALGGPYIMGRSDEENEILKKQKEEAIEEAKIKKAETFEKIKKEQEEALIEEGKDPELFSDPFGLIEEGVYHPKDHKIVKVLKIIVWFSGGFF